MIIALQQVPAALGVDVHAEKVLVLAARAVKAWGANPEWVPLAHRGRRQGRSCWRCHGRAFAPGS